MRMMMKVSIPVEAGSEAIRNGTFAEVMGTAMSYLQPEAVYCVSDHGQRTAIVVFDLKEPQQIPAVAEPLFQGLGASIDLTPCMTMEDVQSGLAQWQGGQ
jgi:hypothetical protein